MITMPMKQSLKTNYPDIVRIFRLASYELESLAAHWRGRISYRQRTLIRSLRQSRGLKLNIASGRTGESGWINLDVSTGADIQMDLRRPIPLPAGSAKLIFCEHFCDHLNFPDEISRFLSECHRLLEPGGRARFVLHDAEGLLRAVLQRDTRYFEVAEQMSPTIMESVNFLFRFNDAHQFLYDYETFERLLLVAGFAQVIRCKYRQSDCQELLLDFVHPSREVMSMYIEAVK
jgi:predicted SAM-dependent methyltransferase